MERSRCLWAEESESCRREEKWGDDDAVAADVASAAVRSGRETLILR